MAYKTLACEKCGSKFEGWHNAKYCSDECNPHKTGLLFCEVCGDEIGESSGRIKYCSKECDPNVRTEPVFCKHCGEEMGDVSGGKKYCSDKCNRKHKYIEKECSHCGIKYLVHPIRSDESKYCSKECSNAKKSATKEEIEEWVELYDSGYNIHDIADERGWSAHTVNKHLKREGVDLDRGPDEEEVDKWVKMYDEKEKSLYYIADKSEEWGYDSVRRRLRDRGVEMRTSGFYIRRTPNEDGYYECKDCGEYKPPTEFYSNRYRYSDLQHQCKDCRSIRDNNRRGVEKEGNFHSKYLDEMLKEQDGRCIYCGDELPDDFHLDHKTPISRGGEHTRENVHLTCPDCNRQKHAKTHDEYLQYRRENDLPISNLALQ